MRTLKYLLILVLNLCVVYASYAYKPTTKFIKPKRIQDAEISYRADCTNAKSQTDQNINNVRARLLTGGDVWWDLDDGKYIVPNVDPESGIPEVSSIFAGAVWLGGYDPVGNLKFAAQTYRSAQANDFWPGPLDPFDGTTEKEICEDWDKFFKVLGENIETHIKNYELSQLEGVPYDCETIPLDVLGWPGRGNPYFYDIHDFELPNTAQGLGYFFDRNENGLYDPCEGEYPVIEIRGCPKPQYPDEMIFWIYNDAGGIHTQTQGKPIQMEVQVQAFAYATNDEINDMTFQRYKLINRATQDITDTYFAMWVDPDIGCYTDDYIGCDTSRSLAYVYNEDVLDGETGCSCPGGVATYCDQVPVVGVDYFRGPLNEFGEEIGMSSFVYYNNSGVGSWPNAMTDPDLALEYYNYISGKWKDGTPFTYGGSGYNIGSQDSIKYAFTEPPNLSTGWSMCTANLDYGDRRTIQASGPFSLKPGAVNELIIGVPWVPDIDYPCPDIQSLLSADDLAQALFDNCFEIPRGPDAPDLDFIELDKELICILTNDEFTSNNAFEEFEEAGLLIPLGVSDSLYFFEGYKVFQLSGPEVTTGELDNIEKARIIFQADVRNGVNSVYNWTSISDPNPVNPLIWLPEIKVQGADDGVRHTFQILEDQFATDDRQLINHKKYYFTAIAYAYNNFEQFDPRTVIGQKFPYLEGRKNIRTYIPIPRPIVYEHLNAEYGDQPYITRLSGQGVGGNFLDITEETRENIITGNFGGEITYEKGSAPIDVFVFNPLDVKSGEFILTFYDEDNDPDLLAPDTRWELENVNDPSFKLLSDNTIEKLNEQVIAEYGFSIAIEQTDDAGDKADDSNGAIGVEYEWFEPDTSKWFSAIPDASSAVDFVRTSDPIGNSLQYNMDPKQGLSTGFGVWYPYLLTYYKYDPTQLLITPAWIDPPESNGFVLNKGRLSNLNNVDIVFTSDKSKWSRCVVIETANPYYTEATQLGLSTQGGSKMFELRNVPSVGKEADGNGMPVPDGDGIGMGWFPGYAIDVETGKRLNIFFGENSTYDGTYFPELFENGPAGGDMMFNPSPQAILQVEGGFTAYNLYFGGHHYIYVTDQEYDECEVLRAKFEPGGNPLKRVNYIKDIQWTCMPMLAGNTKLWSYADGLIPNDLAVKLRVDNPYQMAAGVPDYEGHPAYHFEFEGVMSEELVAEEYPEALANINVVPNPYYAYSEYETSQFSNTVKITNLPNECDVTIYSLDGKFIRQYKRNESGQIQLDRTNPPIASTEVVPDLEWNLKNDKGIPVASGVYLIHVNAPRLGERIIKWFGIARKFDPTGL